MKRGIVAATLVAGMLALGAGPASAQVADCSAFGHTQTYPSWGPAAYYGETVTVSFSATECTAGHEGPAFAYELTGTATVFPGTEAAGEPFDVLPFESTGVFTDLDGSGWPPSWWSCDTEAAQISWRIPGVYAFTARAVSGTWSLAVEVPGTDPIHWDHAAC